MSSMNTTGCTCPPTNSAIDVPHQSTCPMYSPPIQMDAKEAEETWRTEWTATGVGVYRPGWLMPAFRCEYPEFAQYAAKLLQNRDEEIRALQQQLADLKAELTVAQDALDAIEFTVFDIMGEDDILVKIYTFAHSGNQTHSCYHVHTARREEAKVLATAFRSSPSPIAPGEAQG